MWAIFPGQAQARRDGKIYSPLLTDLVAYYTLDEASGTRLDSSAHALSLSDTNSVGSVSGIVGNAARFTAASSNKLSSSDSAFAFSDEDFTLAFWLKIRALENPYPGVIGKYGDPGSNRRSYALVLGRDENDWWWSLSSDGSAQSSISLGTLAPLDTWTFVVLGHDAANNLQWARVNNGSLISQAYSAGVHAVTAVPFALGRADADYGGSASSTDIDECGVWSRRLSDAEQTYLYNSGAGRTWPLS